MMKSFVVLITLLAFGGVFAFAWDQKASNRCLTAVKHRNPNDQYPGDDCYSYLLCVFVNATYAIGSKFKCPVGQYWHRDSAQCLPEEPNDYNPCNDFCKNKEVAEAGCYASPNDCATFFLCYAGKSYALCCPPKTRFHQSTCSCIDDPQCIDHCSLPPPPVTTPSPITTSEIYCLDAHGKHLKQGADAYHYMFKVRPGLAYGDYNFPCPRGTRFSMDSCSCEEPNAVKSPRNCLIYLPFDDDMADHAFRNFKTQLIEHGEIDKTVFAQGGGSLSLSGGGYLQVAARYAMGKVKSFSLCLYYRCRNLPCTGGIFTNDKDLDKFIFDVTIASLSDNSFHLQGEGVFDVAAGPIFIDPSTNRPNNFTQICIAFTGSMGNIYINNELAFSMAARPTIEVVRRFITIGTHPNHGSFDGYIDEVLVCPFGLDAREVNAHWNGRDQLEKVGLVPKK